MRLAVAVLAALGAACVAVPGALAATFVVDNTGDASGQACTAVVADCSLRSAIEQANANSGADQITFGNGLTGAQTIAVGSALPTITGPVTIDGTTEPGWLGPPIIRVEGAGGSYDGIVVDSGGAGSVIRSLSITGFGQAGVAVHGDNVGIFGNDVGTDSVGTDLGNGLGIQVDGSSVTIGGTTAADRNVVSGNGGFISYGIWLTGGTGHVVSGNYIGTTPDGLSTLGNGSRGIGLEAGVTATIGGDNTGAGTPACDGACNLISGNNSGIETLATDATIQGNWIGLAADGSTALGNGTFGGGILLGANPGSATVGGATAAKRNVIAGHDSSGISISGAAPNSIVIKGNYIGTDATGSSAVPNGSGIVINSTNGVQIGGTNAGEGNLISGNDASGFVVGDAGILLYNGSDGTQIQGNRIGINAAGSAGLGNVGPGILVRGSPNTVIGGTTGTTPGGSCTGACNVITSNTGAGVTINDFNGFFSTGVTVEGNFVGLTPTGGGPFANNQGVSTNSQGTTIGGTSANARNVIAGNTSFGVVLNGNADNATIQGNYIGTDPAGTLDLGNSSSGIIVGTGADNAQVGGTAAGAGNLISGNQSAGIDVNGDDAVIEGNLIGTQADGSTALGNSGSGITVDGQDGTIGGTTAASRNVIAANGADGVSVDDQSSGLWIQGNYIGVTSSGNTKRGNGANAIDAVGSVDLLIGGPPGAGNVIGGSAIEVQLDKTDDATVQGNSIGIGADGTSNVGVNSGCPCSGINVLELAEVPSPHSPLIGGNAASDRNLIGNGGDGVSISQGAEATEVRGNWLGFDATGAAAGNAGVGVRVDSTDFVEIGGSNTGGTASCDGECNLISSNFGGGISVTNSGGIVVQGNWVGVDSTGAAARANTSGVLMADAAADIGGTTASHRNVVSGNTVNGILLSGGLAGAYTVQGNYVGTNAAGTAAVRNGQNGIRLEDTQQATIGGSGAGEGNLVSGNGTTNGATSPTENGILVTGDGDANLVAGNSIGTNAAGTAVLANVDPQTSNANYGIHVFGATNTIIGGESGTTPGGACTGACNVIAGSGKYAISVEDNGIAHPATGATVEGNMLGTDVNGTAALPNLIGGVLVRNDQTTIGSGAAAGRNVISGNSAWGVALDSTSGTTNIRGNYIGTDTTGSSAVGNGAPGVQVFAGLTVNAVIGGTTAGYGNVISGNQFGVSAAANGVVVQGNLIGTNAAGTSAIANLGVGVRITGSNGTIGGSTAAERNVISGNGNYGVELQGASNTVSGNYIGTNAAGTAAIGNVIYGVRVVTGGATNNVIGGNTAGRRNIISGSNSVGVISEGGASGTKIQGNYIGTDVTGSAALPNGTGVMAFSGVTIGGANPGEGNLISGNAFEQVQTNFTETVAGNIIGLNAAGNAALDPNANTNGVTGIEVDGAGVTIGGTTNGARNVISGQRDGIILRSGANNAVIRRNYIGTNVAGNAAVGGRYGIWIDRANGADIGGANPSDKNVLSGNFIGVHVDGGGVGGGDGDANTIRNNYIGTDVTGMFAVANTQSGISLYNGSTNTLVGGSLTEGNLISGNPYGVLASFTTTGNILNGNRIGPKADGTGGIGNSTGVLVMDTSKVSIGENYTNTIAHNTGVGVDVGTTGTGQAKITGNDIYSNGGLGIDLDPPTGVDTNDSGDGDGGPNNGQNYPVITNAVSGGNIDYSLNTNPGDYRVDFFRSSSCDPSSHGEGEDWLASQTINHGAAPNQAYSTGTFGALGSGDYLTMTATSAGAGATVGDTSEFSACFLMPASPTTYTVDRNDDSGGLACTAAANDCTLRSAIQKANANTGATDTIDFALPGSTTIAPDNDLPQITDPVTIDATTQSGFAGSPIVVLDGGPSTLQTGLELAAGSGGSTVRGLVIGNFLDTGILLGSDGNTIEGNRVGVGTDGSTAFPNGTGISAQPTSDGNMIGGADPLKRNVISGNTHDGIELATGGVSASDNDTVIGNYIGTDAAGTGDLGNGDDGIIADGGSTITIGGVSSNDRNVVSGNGAMGMRLLNLTDAVVQGNYIGVDVTGNAPLGNDTYGINLVTSTDPKIGGTAAGAGNVVGGNLSGLYLESNDGAVVQGNYIGVGADGFSDVGNIDPANTGGITIDQPSVVPGATPTLIGGTVAGARNYIANNTDGVELDEADDGTMIQGNYIGVDAGENRAGNLENGIDVFDTDGTLIGGSTASARNVIAGPGGSSPPGASITINNSSVGTMIQGNYISTDPTGTAETWGNRVAVYLDPSTQSTAIGGSATVAGDAPGNLFGSDGDAELHIDGSNGNVVRGNSFGFEAGFTDRLTGNGPAILIDNGAQNNVIGNDTGSGSDYNAIGFSGDESSPGVVIEGAGTSDNNVVGNLIGLYPDGVTAAANDDGVLLSGGTHNNTIGGFTAALGNVISGNNTGIHMIGAANLNEAVGNRIGTTLDGTAALGNSNGVIIEDGAHGNSVGGNSAAAGNLISGNTYAGVLVDGGGSLGTSGNEIKGNSIGVAADLTTPLGQDIGVQLDGDAEHTVVGDSGAGGNLIANSDDANVLVINGSVGNTIEGNTIKDGSDDGIRIINLSDNNTVLHNTVTGNAGAGVAISGVGDIVSENSIDSNGGLGIDLAPPGVLANDYSADCGGGDPDCDGGFSNDGQNYPDLTGAGFVGPDLQVDGTLDSHALFSGHPAHYTVEVFASPACDTPGGNGEGATFLGSTGVVVNGAGHAVWQVTDTNTVAAPGQVITATATDEDGNTSEFSQCFTLVSSPLVGTINLTQDSSNVRAGAQSVPISGIDLGALTRGAGPSTASAPLDGIPLEGIKIAGSPLEGIPLEGIGLTPQILNQALGGVHLSDIPLTPPASWPVLLAGTRLENVPLSTLTLADVLSLPALPSGFHSITLGTIDLSSSPLEGIALGGLALGPKLLSAVPLEGIATTTPAQNLQDWCDAINAQPGYSCVGAAGAAALANETVISQVVRGVPLEGIPLDGIPLEGINLAGTPLEGIPLEGIDLSGTPLEGIPLEGINMSVSPLEGIPLEGINIIGSPLEGIPLEGIPLVESAIVCTGGFCLPSAGHTLGDAVAQNRVRPGATLGMLDGGFGTVTLDNLVDALKNGSGLSLADLVPGLPPGHTLHDLLAAMLGSSAYDWSALNLNTFPIADFSSDGGVAHYHADFEVTGGALLIQPVTIHATLPAGGRYVPHSSVRSPGGAIADPTLGAGGQLSWSFNALRGQPYTLSWDVKPGLDLGSSAVGANIQLSNGTTLATPVATNVIQTFNNTNSPNGDTNNDPDTAPTLAGNSLYVSHLTKGDVDYYKIPIGPFGSRVEVTLSHIPSGSDYDLALAGPPAPRLRAAPVNTIPLGNQELPDTQVQLNHRDQPLPPEALQDVPTAALATNNRVVRGVADNRGSSPEHLSLVSQGESGSWTVQISDYQGDSPDPYVLEVKSIPSPDFGPCAQRSIANSTVAAGPSVNAGTQTLFLVDEKRLIATFGTSATSTLMTKLSTLAGRSDVVGAVARVETGPGVAAAYDAWDGSPCSPEAANNVVRKIGSYLDTLEAAAPNLKYVVVVGGDDIVPFARVPDNTEIANERTYRESLGQVDNEYLSSIGQGFLLTDDVWGEKAAPEFLGNELFVPELAVGRLVESPTDIGKTIDGFTAANGLLTPTSSLVTGYDFLTDGAQQINVPFAAGLGTNAKTLISETWDRNALLAQLFPAGGGGPKLNSLNAHFDHNRLLPASENAASRQTNLVTTADVTAAMSGRLGFSLGCHSGLAVSDAIFGAANLLKSDWAQAMLGNGAAGWIGNTGYGLGDTTDVAYSERLHALFARKLDGTLTLGQALEQAKQDYLGTSAVLTGYDAKVMMEATLYGLPMLRLGAGIPPAPPPPPPLHTDPATGLQAASFDVTPTFTRVTTANGKYDKADAGIQSTPRRPLEPLVSLDVTQPGTLVAHGALINLLNSPTADETSFDAVFSQVTTDQAADDPTLAGVNAFPSKIQGVATFSGLTARKQRLNLVVGLFRSDGPTLAGIGTYRRYTRVAGDTLYSTSDDWLEPQLGELESLRIGTGGNVGFAASITDPTPSGPGSIVKSVKVIFRDCNGTWRTATLQSAVGNRWTGAGTVLPAGCPSIDYYLEAADGAGNVAVSSKKVQLEPVTVPAPVTPPGASAITHTLLPASPTASGWYAGSVQVTLSSAESIRYDVDGVETDYTGPFTVAGDGVHFIHAHTPLGATDDIGFAIDARGPVTTITRTPGTPDANGWYIFNVNELVSALDSGSDVAQIRCVLDPSGPAPTLFSQLPASCPYAASGGGNITADGLHKLYAAAIDGAGNAGAVVSDTFQIDRSPPVATVGALPAFQTSPSFSPAWSGTDVGSGIANFDVRYRQAASNASSFGGYTTWQSATPALTAVFNGTVGATTCFSARARDNATWLGVYGAESCSATLLDDATMTRSGSWSTTSAADLYGGTASRTTTPGSTLTSPTLVGKQIALLVTKQPSAGTIQLKWNGNALATVNLTATTRQPKQLLIYTFSAVQSGTLQVSDTAYGTVDIDAVGAFKTP